MVLARVPGVVESPGYTVFMYSLESARLTPGRPAQIIAGSTPVAALSATIAAGFPSPAEDHAAKRVDLNEVLIRHPLSTYLMRVRGASMREAGIDDGDVVLGPVPLGMSPACAPPSWRCGWPTSPTSWSAPGPRSMGYLWPEEHHPSGLYRWRPSLPGRLRSQGSTALSSSVPCSSCGGPRALKSRTWRRRSSKSCVRGRSGHPCSRSMRWSRRFPRSLREALRSCASRRASPAP